MLKNYDARPAMTGGEEVLNTDTPEPEMVAEGADQHQAVPVHGYEMGYQPAGSGAEATSTVEMHLHAYDSQHYQQTTGAEGTIAPTPQVESWAANPVEAGGETRTNQERKAYNRDYDWEMFDPEPYVAENYAEPLAVDQKILKGLADFHESIPPGGTCIEIGAGPNLYPLLAGAKSRDKIIVTDISRRLLDYTQDTISGEGLGPIWGQWQEQLEATNPEFANHDVSQTLREKCEFAQCSVMDLPENSFDALSMHFVVESMTKNPSEMVEGLKKALGSLKPDGRFAMSFMLSSEGYSSPGEEFPAVSMTASQVEAMVGSLASELHCQELPFNVRAGHEGILFVTGTK